MRSPQIASRRVTTVAAADASASDIPRSFEACVSQACRSVRVNLFGEKGSRSRRMKSLRRICAEIPIVDTSVENSLFLTEQLVDALQADGITGTSVVYSRKDLVDAARDRFMKNKAVHMDQALKTTLGSRLLIFSPTEQQEDALFELLDDSWRGETVLLFNPEFSEDFKQEKASFLRAFNTVYCFMPLAVKVFIQSTQISISDSGSLCAFVLSMQRRMAPCSIGKRREAMMQNGSFSWKMASSLIRLVNRRRGRHSSSWRRPFTMLLQQGVQSPKALSFFRSWGKESENSALKLTMTGVCRAASPSFSSAKTIVCL